MDGKTLLLSPPAHDPPSFDGSAGSAQAVAFGDLDQQLVVVADDPVDAEVDHPLHRSHIVDRVRYDFETLGLQPWYRWAVVVSRVLTQVPVIGNDRTLMGVMDLPVG